MKNRPNPLVPIGVICLACAQLLKRFFGPIPLVTLLFGAGCGCMLLGVLLNRPGRGKFKASKKRLIYGGLADRKKRTSN